MLKVGFLDDHQVVLNGLKHYFESRFEIVFALTNPQTLMDHIQKYQPDVLVIDIVIPKINFLDLYKEILQEYPNLRVISYSSLNDPIVEIALKKLGVEELISKNEPLEALYQVIIRKNKQETENLPNSSQPELLKLTKTEIRIIKYLSEGKSTKMIAVLMVRSYKTIDNHKQNIFKKLQISNVGELISKAHRWGILS